jgi:hypothetical protein
VKLGNLKPYFFIPGGTRYSNFEIAYPAWIAEE